MRRLVVLLAALSLAAVACGRSSASGPLLVGAVYPTGGGQGKGGIDEYRGASLAAELVNRDGGVNGRPIRLALERTDSGEAAPGAVERLADRGAEIIIGSYGSTISLPAAEAATKRDVVFWETGAVGFLGMKAATGELVFRFPPTGGRLGREAVTFVEEQLKSRLGAAAKPLRYTVAYVDDVYGRSVGLGAVAEIEDRTLVLADTIPYDLRTADYPEIARRIAKARTDVLVVSAYLEDAVALRRAMLEQKVPLVASIGTSSSYCMTEFGNTLGAQAVGLYASDKPNGDVLDPSKLAPDAATALRTAREEYRAKHGEPMSAAALTGFSATWALFRHVLPAADGFTSDAIAKAAREADLPLGALPNGSGLKFAPAGAPDAGSNMRATSVIWEWVKPKVKEVVWPPAFATHEIVPLEI